MQPLGRKVDALGCLRAEVVPSCLWRYSSSYRKLAPKFRESSRKTRNLVSLV